MTLRWGGGSAKAPTSACTPRHSTCPTNLHDYYFPTYFLKREERAYDPDSMHILWFWMWLYWWSIKHCLLCNNPHMPCLLDTPVVWVKKALNTQAHPDLPLAVRVMAYLPRKQCHSIQKFVSKQQTMLSQGGRGFLLLKWIKDFLQLLCFKHQVPSLFTKVFKDCSFSPSF